MNLLLVEILLVLRKIERDKERERGRIQSISKEYELNLKITKTKWMIINKNQFATSFLIVNKQLLEHVDSNVYLGKVINALWNQSIEIWPEIKKKKKQRFEKFPQLRLIKYYIFPLLLYGEWTIMEEETRSIWLWRIAFIWCISP